MSDENSKKVLVALARFSAPASGKEIAQIAEMDSKQVSDEIKTLKKNGYVDSPVRCKYAITDSGKETLNE